MRETNASRLSCYAKTILNLIKVQNDKWRYSLQMRCVNDNIHLKGNSVWSAIRDKCCGHTTEIMVNIKD